MLGETPSAIRSSYRRVESSLWGAVFSSSEGLARGRLDEKPSWQPAGEKPTGQHKKNYVNFINFKL